MLKGKVALVAGATRGAGRGIARELGAAGAIVYCTGRSTTNHPSEMNRPETIEETAALIEQEGGRAIAVPTDHLDQAQVKALVERIEREQGRLDVLVNDIWGGDRDTHHHESLRVAALDQESGRTRRRSDRWHCGL